MKTTSIIACHECDLLHHTRSLPDGGVAQCIRCGAVLYRRKRDSLDRTLSLTIAGLILFVVANTCPFLALKSGGIVHQTTLITGTKELYAQGMEVVALLVLFTSILARCHGTCLGCLDSSRGSNRGACWKFLCWGFWCLLSSWPRWHRLFLVSPSTLFWSLFSLWLHRRLPWIRTSSGNDVTLIELKRLGWEQSK